MEYEEIKTECNNLSNENLEDLIVYLESLSSARELDDEKNEDLKSQS